MRIALIHSYYRSNQPSGENPVVEAQLSALSDAGHVVKLISRHTDTESQLPGYPIRAAARTVLGSGPDPTRRLERFQPDVVHVHNLFPNIGDRWLDHWEGPIVNTMHNFRPLCANGFLFRDGGPCTACPDGAPWSAIKNSCYHDSHLASIPLAVKNSAGIGKNRLLRRSDGVIIGADRAREVYEQYGLDPHKIRVIPHGLAEHLGPRDAAPTKPRWVGVGRLSPEKGFRELVEAWPEDAPLDIYGDGPQREEIGRVAPKSVRLLGQVDRDTLRERIAGYTGLVFPSRWFEMNPYTIVEALEAGLPIVALAGSGAADTVLRYKVGAVYSDADSLRASLTRLAEADSTSQRAHSQQVYAEQFSVAAWVRSLESLYDDVQK